MSEKPLWQLIEMPPADNTPVLLAMRQNREIRQAVFEDGMWIAPYGRVNELNILCWMPAPTHPYDA